MRLCSSENAFILLSYFRDSFGRLLNPSMEIIFLQNFEGTALLPSRFQFKMGVIQIPDPLLSSFFFAGGRVFVWLFALSTTV